jgi:hypothetical protein
MRHIALKMARHLPIHVTPPSSHFEMHKKASS